MEPIEPPTAPWFSRWDLLPLAGAGALALAMPWLLRGLPDPIPTHFDAQGLPNGWTSQASYPWVAQGLAAAIWGLLLLTGRAFVGSSQDPDGRKCAALAPLRALVTLGLVGLSAGGLLIPRHGQGVILWMIVGFLALTGLGIALLVRELKRNRIWEEEGQHYRWGLFYVNTDDPAIWVPKRLGLGWTLNFAHGVSWLFLLLLLSPLLILGGLALARR